MKLKANQSLSAPLPLAQVVAAAALAAVSASSVQAQDSARRGATAALLEEAVLDACAPNERDAVRRRARFIDTVIGKMSGVITDADELRENGLATITSVLDSAFLVEEFDRILVSRAGEGLHPGMPVLREVDDLAPFEDAKLLGHNATHALAGFLGQMLGLTLVADLREVPGAMAFLRTAFLDESGATLRRRSR